MVPRRVRNYSVLITDDDDELRYALSEGLQVSGYRTLQARCGYEAIEVVRHELVHVLIMDVNMPDLSGIETLEVIERILESRLPCIMMSGEISREVIVRVMTSHIGAFLRKPLRLDRVRMTLAQLIDRYYPE